MLQQTTVAAVKPRFERFLERWPTVQALARAPDEDVLYEWAGLGYYARARNLIACAREVVSRGGFPQTSAELRNLPGIGVYTSAAIAAIAFGELAAAVDTNVRRVVSRLAGLADPNPADIEKLVLKMIPPERAGDLTQAMMDLGATICRPKAPRCGTAPFGRIAPHTQAALPKPSPLRNRSARVRTVTASLIGRRAKGRSGSCGDPPRGCSAEWPHCQVPIGRRRA